MATALYKLAYSNALFRWYEELKKVEEEVKVFFLTEI